MSKPFLTVAGLFAYDDSIFDGLQLPAGVDKESAVKKIIFDNAELPLIYIDPDLFKLHINVWWKTNKRSWERIINALSEDYNALYNYDRTEQWEDTGTDSGSTDAENVRQVGGWNNVEGWSDAEKSKGTSTDNRSRANTRNGRAYGNIGVTTSQQMLESEIDLRLKYNALQIISDSFRDNFCIQIY